MKQERTRECERVRKSASEYERGQNREKENVYNRDKSFFKGRESEQILE